MENPKNIAMVCSSCAPKAGQFTGQDPNFFVGKDVKLAFAAIHPVSGEETKEHMWISVIKAGEFDLLYGKLKNRPVLQLKSGANYGDEISFTVEEVEDVYDSKASWKDN